jgi:hypothetical protein
MTIRGLSNQWKTREELLDGITRNCGQEKSSKIRQLIEFLDARSGPTIYVGTSHSQINLSNQDAFQSGDRTQPFAYVDVATDTFCYIVETRLIENTRPTTRWIRQEIADIDKVTELLVEALDFAEIPPRPNRNGNAE